MIEYLILQSLLASLVLGALGMLREAPPRLKFSLCVFAMTLWLLPLRFWQVPIGGLPTAGFDVAVRVERTFDVKLLDPIAQVGTSQRQVPFSPRAILYIVGLTMFLVDVVRHRRVIGQLAQSVEPLKIAHPQVPDGLQIKWVPRQVGAMVSGLFRPVIWVGDVHGCKDAFDALIHHEMTHIRQRDHLWTWWLTFLKRLFWWSPFVWMFSRLANRYMENSCDLVCAQHLGRRAYQNSLASFIRQATFSGMSEFAGVGTHSKPNIDRLKYLERNPRMKWTHLVTLLAAAVFCAALVARPVPTQTDNNQHQDEIARVGQPGTEPPVFTRKIKPDYPERAAKIKLQGYVIIEAVLRKDRTITDLNVLRGLGRGQFGFEDAAIEAIKQWEFVPGTVNGKPADVRMVLKIDFVLKDGTSKYRIIGASELVSLDEIASPSLSEMSEPSALKGQPLENLPVRFWINEQGEVEDLTMGNIGDHINSALLSEVRDQILFAKFRPATHLGQPIRVQVETWHPFPIDLSRRQARLAELQNVGHEWVIPKVDLQNASAKALLEFLCEQVDSELVFEHGFTDAQVTYSLTNVPFPFIMNIVTRDIKMGWVMLDDIVYVGPEDQLMRRVDVLDP